MMKQKIFEKEQLKKMHRMPLFAQIEQQKRKAIGEKYRRNGFRHVILVKKLIAKQERLEKIKAARKARKAARAAEELKFKQAILNHPDKGKLACCVISNGVMYPELTNEVQRIKASLQDTDSETDSETEEDYQLGSYEDVRKEVDRLGHPWYAQRVRGDVWKVCKFTSLNNLKETYDL